MKEKKTKKEGTWVVVLSDGETWTGLDGCKLMWLPQKAIDMCNGLDADEFIEEVEEELGSKVAQEIKEYDLEATLRPMIGAT